MYGETLEENRRVAGENFICTALVLVALSCVTPAATFRICNTINIMSTLTLIVGSTTINSTCVVGHNPSATASQQSVSAKHLYIAL